MLTRTLIRLKLASDGDDLFEHFEKLEEHNIPTIQTLRRYAHELHDQYSTQRAWVLAMQGGSAADSAGWVKGKVWESGPMVQEEQHENIVAGFSEAGGQGVADEHATAQEREPHASSSSSEDASSPSSNAESSVGSDQGVSGDQSLAQSILFMRDTMVSRDASHAVASGDVGRLWEDMKVSIAHLLNMWSSFSRLCSLGSVGTDNMHNWVTDDDIQLCWL